MKPKSLISSFLVCTSLLSCGLLGSIGIGAKNVYANENSEVNQVASTPAPPEVFENAKDINAVVQQIDDFYLYGQNTNSMLRASPGTKWANSTVVWDGSNGQWVTNYFWVSGSSMQGSGIVPTAERKAVIAKYGSVNNKTSYKMKTSQLIRTTSYQTQGYITLRANAWCYAKD